MTVKHTPGPWFAGKDCSEYASEVAKSEWVISSDDDHRFSLATLVMDIPDLRAAAEANASLIAASPDMLSALKLVVKTVASPNGSDSDFEDQVFAAIAKAEGEST